MSGQSGENQICKERIHVITEYSQKISWEKQLRSLWSTCFGDPQHYEDFYFEHVYPHNKVYAIEGKGMIHVNSYRCRVMGKEIALPYIVGVATDAGYRRQGVMRSLLSQVYSDLLEQKIPFAYLMPANEEYYKPFGFRSISKKSECEYLLCDVRENGCFQFVPYEEIKKLSPEMQSQLMEEVNRWMERRYDVYAVHDEAYYGLLYEEKNCQSGDVIFCFDGAVDVKHLYGMFAYAMDGDIPCVEQILMKEQVSQSSEMMKTLFRSFFTECDKVKLVQSYPYMLRIIDRNAFVKLFEERLSTTCDLSIVDMDSCGEMIENLFTGKNNVYFAEII